MFDLLPGSSTSFLQICIYKLPPSDESLRLRTLVFIDLWSSRTGCYLHNMSTYWCRSRGSSRGRSANPRLLIRYRNQLADRRLLTSSCSSSVPEDMAFERMRKWTRSQKVILAIVSVEQLFVFACLSNMAAFFPLEVRCWRLPRYSLPSYLYGYQLIQADTRRRNGPVIYRETYNSKQRFSM